MKDPECSGKQSYILRQLHNSPYACSSATQLSGGIANLSYRGILFRALEDGSTSVIIKYSEEKLAKASHIRLSTNRCVSRIYRASVVFKPRDIEMVTNISWHDIQLTEYTILRALQFCSAQQFFYRAITIRCPQAYHYMPQGNIQILQYFPHDCTIHDLIMSLDKKPVDGSTIQALGEALAAWLSRFHEWSRDVSKPNLLDVVRLNTDSLGKDLSANKLRSVERQCKDEKVVRYASQILNPTPHSQDCLVHGDFSTRK